VYASDLRGHGRSAERDEDLGWFEGGWARVVRDVAGFVADERARHPGVPFVLFGHSMGSFIVQQTLWNYPEGIDGAVLSGSNGRPGLLAQAGRVVTRIERARLGPRGRSKLLDQLSFGGFNKPFAPNRTEFDWLSRDAAEVDRYIADPRCGFICTTALWVDIVDALPGLTRPDRLARIPRDLPVYIFSGERDPVGEAGAGVRRLVDQYRAAGLSHTKLQLYPEGRHEMLNDVNRSEVIANLAAWLDEVKVRS
jgi:alpha-beta hydrolase superfamily lysophospholipase